MANEQDAASGRLHAVALRRDSIGYSWTPVQGLGIKDTAALSVWLNSTPMRLIWRIMGSRRLDFPVFQPAAINSMPIPDPTAGQGAAMQLLHDSYQSTKGMTVGQYRDGPCECRDAWDEAAAKVLDIDKGVIRGWAELLAEEPATKKYPNQSNATKGSKK